MFIAILILLLSSCDLITTDPPIINNQDRIPPIITLLGDDTIYLEVNTVYEEFGATCKDDIDANCQITVTNTELNMELPGIYTVYYNATDSSGNKASTVTRTVIVQDLTKPVIKLLGQDVLYLEVNTVYEEFGATCKDDIDANCQITVTNTELNMELPGIYTVYYNATDSSGNKANTVTRTVIVQDLTSPIIKLLGQDVLYLALNDPYIELGLNCSVEGNFECQVTIDSSLVDMTAIGTYTVSYTATDGNSNTSTLNRTIIVEDRDNRVMTVPK